MRQQLRFIIICLSNCIKPTDSRRSPQVPVTCVDCLLLTPAALRCVKKSAAYLSRLMDDKISVWLCGDVHAGRQASTCALAGQEWRPVKSSNFPALYTNRQGNHTQDPLEIKSRTITNQSSGHFYLYLGVSRVNATWNISVQTLQNVSHCGGKKKPWEQQNVYLEAVSQTGDATYCQRNLAICSTDHLGLKWWSSYKVQVCNVSIATNDYAVAVWQNEDVTVTQSSPHVRWFVQSK